METSRDRGRATRAKILRATAELIAERGWSGFGTREIAGRAGVTQGIVSYHWRSKDQLLREAALTATADSLAPVAAALRDAPSVRQALAAAVTLVESARHESQLTLLFFETMLNAARDEQLRDALARTISDFRSDLASALAREGHEDPEPLAAAVSAALDGLFLHAVVDRTVDVPATASVLLRLVEKD